MKIVLFYYFLIHLYSFRSFDLDKIDCQQTISLFMQKINIFSRRDEYGDFVLPGTFFDAKVVHSCHSKFIKNWTSFLQLSIFYQTIIYKEVFIYVSF